MAQPSPPWGHYTRLHPDEIAAIRTAAPIACVPWGALNWHGPHLPVGVDGIIVEAVAEQVIQRTGGVLLPTTWWATAPMHHSASLDIEAPVLRSLWGSLFASLAAAGWDIIVVISGHCAPGHELLLMDAAEETINRHGVLVLALPPLALVDETMLDHAALWETSLLLALQPDLVNLPALGSAPLNAEESGVVGQDPRGAASPSLGSTAMHMAVEHLVKAVQQLRNKGNAAELAALYAQRRTRYRA